MKVPGLIEALQLDDAVARQHGVEFSVVSRPTGFRPPGGPPDNHGTFDNPADAIAVGRSLSGRDVTILANGLGAYWYT
ncbi:MAG: hypothetical protein ACR2QO_06125, partial [Acidimicrobiales bacterium]